MTKREMWGKCAEDEWMDRTVGVAEYEEFWILIHGKKNVATETEQAELRSMAQMGSCVRLVLQRLRNADSVLSWFFSLKDTV